jgi:hypothetical protein
MAVALWDLYAQQTAPIVRFALKRGVGARHCEPKEKRSDPC